MFRNYATIAIRSLLKHKLYSSINIVGLALGMACSLLIGLWVKDELSYNRYLPDAENIYFVRFNSTNPNTGEVGTNYVTPGPLQEAIAKDVPEVAAVTKTTWGDERLIKVGERAAKEMGQYATDAFFDVFNLPAQYGDPKAALTQPNRIVITQKIAEKYFPNGLALGKTLQLNNEKYYTVGAVLANLPTTSTLQFDWLVNWKEQEQPWQKTWGNNSFRTYARLKPNVTVAHTEATMRSIYPRYVDKRNLNRPILQPITDLHLYGDYKDGKPVGGRIEYVRIFSIVALFMLLIACINFVNLATARSAVRAKEVGVRKVVGAERSALMGQFLSESVLTSSLAIILALVMVWSALPTFNTVFDKQLTLGFTEPSFWVGLIGLLLLTGLLSGSYPAFFLSGLQPVRVLKGALRLSGGPAQFRRVLVVFQFSLSIFLIVGMLAVGQQMRYLRTKHLGLDRENVIYLTVEGEIGQPKRMESFRQEVIRLPAIASATTTMALPVDVNSTSGDLTWPGKDPKLQTSVAAMSVGNDFIRTMNIKLVDGRDFLPNSKADTSNYLINEAAADLMSKATPGMKNPVGKEVSFWFGKGRVVGLMKDFHLNSMHQAISPLILTYTPLNTSYLLIRTRPGQTQQAIAELERLTKQINPNYPFAYHFLDEAYEKLYQSEQQVHTLVNYFGVLAIVISCLGLFALAAFTAEQRKKEIGVRKVLGATVANIVGLLSKDFLALVVLALLLASPLAWWALDKWFGTFAYRTELSWWFFGIAGVLAILIAFLTVSYQSIKSALINPVKSLRSE